MSDYPTWSNVEHYHTDITVVLPVADALRLKAALPQLLSQLDQIPARQSAERDQRRQTRAALEGLLGRLTEGLQAFDVPEACRQP
jgi:hypothetical protein